MSGADSSTRAAARSGSSASKADRLAAFLRAEAADGETYFKAKFIADDVGLSPKEIGALLPRLQESTPDLEIERWGNARATTWRVALA